MPDPSTTLIGPDAVAFSVARLTDVHDDTRPDLFPWEAVTGDEHPSTPTAVAVSLWAAVREGRPFVGYLDVLGPDGVPHAEFAAVSPIDDHLLTVRVQPQCTELIDEAATLYGRVRPVEDAFRAAGASPAQATEAGCHQLEAVMGELGVRSYDVWSAHALPAEVLRRGANRGRLPWPAASGTHRTLGTETRWLHQLVARWVGQADAVQGLLSMMGAVGRRIDVAAVANEHSARAFTSVLDRGAKEEDGLTLLRTWIDARPDEQAAVALVNEALDTLPEPVAVARFRIAMAALHSETLGHAVAALASGTADVATTKEQAGWLGRSLRDMLPDAAAVLQHTHEVAQEVAGELDSLLALVRSSNDELRAWSAATEGRDSDAVARLRPEVRDALQRGQGDERTLESFITRCRQVGTVDAEEPLAQLERVLELIDQLR